MELDLEVGDVILTGKFKNKRKVVKDFGKDDLGQPTINGAKALNFRIEKLMPKDKWSKESKEALAFAEKIDEGNKIKITKRQLRRIIKETLLREDSDFDRIIATWDSGVDRHGNPSWKKRHKIRSAHVTSDPDASKWEWVVFEFQYRGNPDDEDIIEDDIAQGIETSSRDAILAADKVLVAQRGGRSTVEWPEGGGEL